MKAHACGILVRSAITAVAIATISKGEVSYQNGDTWVLEGATEWTNANPFVGLGTIASLSGADTNTVWALMWYRDICYATLASFLSSPAALNVFVDSPEVGPYRYPNPSWCGCTTDPHVSPINMAYTRHYGARAIGAVVWESPAQGTVSLSGEARYAYGEYAAGALAFGVFYEDVSEGKFHQLQKGLLSWGATSNATLNATVSVDVGDRIIYMTRDYHPTDGYEYLNTTGPSGYLHRWSQHRNLTVTYQGANMDHVAAAPAFWCRADVWWRADLQGVNPAETSPRVAYDRRDPAAPARYYAYVSQNTNMLASPTGLTNGEALTPAGLILGGVGDAPAYNIGVKDESISCRVDGGVCGKPAVWLFKPPKTGGYLVTGTVACVYGDIGNVHAWLGTADVSDWGANPMVQNVRTLWDASQMYSTTNLSVRAVLTSTNSAIFMVVSGWEATGSRSYVLSDKYLVIEPYGLGTLLICR
ncbi:MAG: hypothetical protein PHR35_08265 [Kiritimatiellae bacterium]|nr:hypothetical protein [Kiritimatiellia bacterium]